MNEKPDGMCNAERLAMQMDFSFPEVIDADFLVAFKKVMIEVAGHRLYDYRAAEQVEKLLVEGGHSSPVMEQEAAAEGFSRSKKIMDYIRLQESILHERVYRLDGGPRELSPAVLKMLEAALQRSTAEYTRDKSVPAP